MQCPIVQTEFDAVTRDGREFVVKVAIGDPHDFPTSSGAIDVGFYVEVDPLMDRRRQCGSDSFMAMCFSIQLVRRALAVFVAHGGLLFMRGTRAPIDLQSPWFEPLDGLIRSDYLQTDPASKKNTE
jgi:hypothetical protein